ncbi:hypothetical protein G6F43_000232 [Rhizopus delemar]|nr:hypothetical protein G6F43_000232 [Rhizopus delemar]
MSLVKTHHASASTEYYPKVQPRSSSERDNSFLLHTALKAASTDMAHRLLNYASLDKMDCEASCILIALANHNNNHHPPSKKGEKEKTMIHEKRKMSSTVVEEEKTIVVLPNKQRKSSLVKEAVVQANQNNNNPLKNDPMMLLMAAAEVVEGSREKKRLSEKRISKSSLGNPYHPRDTKESKQHNFSRQYHSMKQNPKIKQNALHAYITYMIYNDLAHGSPSRNTHAMDHNKHHPWYSPPAPSTTTFLEDKKSSSPIISRPLTAFLWNDTSSALERNMILPPLSLNK